ncbi:periplasmic binding protein-like II [Nemania serpens]|nr:periplasmic binding protein-like II [Nemania serpens]
MFLSQMIRPAALLLMISSVTSLKIASKLDVLEWTPELVAKEDYFNGTVSIVDGGIANLTTDASVDLGSNSETQLLRQFGAHKNIRTILTTAEVYYRIVASKRAGIRELKDLRGKRIGAIPSTSSEYFVQTYLASVGLTPSDYTIVSGTACLRRPCGSDTFPAMLRRGAIHAIGMWEPSVQLGADVMGTDAIILGDDQSEYREIYNLATTTEKLADPAKRKEIVAFVRALVKAEDVFRTDPDKVVARAAAAVKTDVRVFRKVWAVHRWSARNPLDILDVMVREDQYVAGLDKRPAMSRDVLATLVDRTVLEDALREQ